MTLFDCIGIALATCCGMLLFFFILVYLVKRELQARKEVVDTIKRCMAKDVKTVNVHAKYGQINVDFDINF